MPYQFLERFQCFGLPEVPRQTARALRSDLRAAGIICPGDGPKVDFHALRVTFATLLDEVGATEKEAQVLMRHAAGSLTYGVYTKVRDERLTFLVEQIAVLITPAKKREAELWD